MTTLTITRPDDWHVHLRDGEVLKDTVRDISRYNGRALIMPNTVPPVTNTEMALAPPARYSFSRGSGLVRELSSPLEGERLLISVIKANWSPHRAWRKLFNPVLLNSSCISSGAVCFNCSTSNCLT